MPRFVPNANRSVITNSPWTGGTGNDTFVFGAASAHDTIADFSAGSDVIQFDKGIFADFTSLLNAATQAGSDVVIAYGEDSMLTINNMTITELTTHHTGLLFV